MRRVGSAVRDAGHDGSEGRLSLRLARDIALIAAAFALCPLAAALAPGDPALPLARLDALVAFERALGLYFEPHVWRWVGDRPALASIAGFLYLWGHLPATVGALVWARLERPRRFGLARDTFLATQLIVVAGYLAAPTAPPWMLSQRPDLGSWVHHLQSPYAALPSGHVAFAVFVAGLVGSQVRALRFVAPLYPLLVTAVVIGTANHLWADAVAGLTAAATGFALAVMARTPRERPENRRGGCTRKAGDVSSDPSPAGGDARSPARA